MHTSDLRTLASIPCDAFSPHLIELLPAGSALRNQKSLLDVTFVCSMLCTTTYLSWNLKITCISIFNSQRKKTTAPHKLQYSAKINQDANDPLSLDYKQESKTPRNIFLPPKSDLHFPWPSSHLLPHESFS